ncbi:DNA polymerase III subunit gamma/tau [Trichlorobacter ammonificans]|uniref:DNA polymerase III subunit gamma/tau n=1 Tax=Trichlorobacter ammonificans TaxID=2916410 RepID=A0ABN8HKX1_9BACT|nr:DNA polymerase III subunit gamma/tau [Trichlorobacter ammonificans]CAH2032674.1 DNA polymerase III subunits gamma and tau [Trichlorobacter ammonificans]
MSYVVLARKYRPQTFADLTGQEHVSRTLQNAIDSGRVAHAFLFTGARGVGKTSSARILAKALNCEQGPSTEPCNVCHLCREITDGTSTDVFEIDGASNTGVDDVRELRDNSRYLPSHSRYKIYIIDEVHMLSTNAFNALLKILEEPPPHVKFIFATTEPHKVPITILSRCQRFDFKRISLARLMARLREISTVEGINISDSALAMIARKGDGSMRDTLSCFDQVLAFCGSTVADDDVATLVGVVDRRLLAELSAAVFAGDAQETLQGVRRVDAFGYNIRQFTQELIAHFRNLLIIRSVAKPEEILDLAEAELTELRQQAADQQPSDIQRRLTLLVQAESGMAQSSFPRLLLEMALLKMATLQPVLPIQPLIERLRQLEAGLPAAPRLSAAPSSAIAAPATPSRPSPRSRPEEPIAAPAAAAPVAAPGTGGTWERFVEFCRSQNPILGGALEHGSPVQYTQERIEIGFPEGSFHLSSMQDAENLARLRRLAADFAGQETTVSVTVIRSVEQERQPLSLAEKKSREQQERREAIRREVLENPVVTEAIRLLEGEIVEIKEL